MEDAIIERLGELIKSLDCNKSSFANRIDMPQASIATLFMRGKTISSQLLARISRVFPQVNLEWLITGEGSMFKAEASVQSTLQQSNSKNVIKYYPSVSGSMGGIEFMDNPEEASMDIILPGFSECKYAINAYGDSMYPVIKSGQVVLLMEWTERFIDWGRIYLVVTKSGYRAIKYLMPSDSNSSIKCESENKEASPAFEIEKEDILKLYLVKGWVCRDTI